MRRTVTIERTFKGATPEEVWELWTTAEGIESWWGPDGFKVKVQKLELRPGGALLYAMIAVDPDKVALMKSAVMPVSVETRAYFTDVTPPRRLAFTHIVNFVPGVEPYETGTVVELHGHGDETHLVLTLEVMHDEEWTQRAVSGWENELGKLAKAIAAR